MLYVYSYSVVFSDLVVVSSVVTVMSSELPSSLVFFSTVISVFTFSEVSVNSVFSVVTPSVVSVVTVASCGISGTSSSFACS